MPIAIQEPIGCGGAVVFPGDIIVGDEDGVVVVPSHLARQIAQESAEREQLDAWIKNLVSDGRGIRGRYPPDTEHLEMYRKWKESKRL